MADAPLNEFTAGTKIQSALVNENFDDVYDELALRLEPVVFSAVTAVNTNTLTDLTETKVLCQSEEFDDAGWYDTATSRFTPQIAGVYNLIGQIQTITALLADRDLRVSIWKNGSLLRNIGQALPPASAQVITGGSLLVTANGTTDYFELYGYQSNGGAVAYGGAGTFFQGLLVRKAVA